MAFLPTLAFSDLPRSEAPLQLRYDDICSDGRMTTLAMPHALGHVWGKTSKVIPLQQLRSAGIVPILSHLWIEGSQEPMLLGAPTRSVGQAALTHTLDDAGQVNRLLLDFYLELFGERGRSVGPRPHGAGEEVQVGAIFARHVFTKPFAPAHERKVLRLSAKGLPELPPARVEWQDFDTMLPLQGEPDAIARGATLRSDLAFGLHHSDSNQHINSLVYPRLFEDAAQTHFASLEGAQPRLSRQVAVAFRKPFFVGDKASIFLEIAPQGQDLAVLGSFRAQASPAQSPSLKVSPHCQLAMRFS